MFLAANTVLMIYLTAAVLPAIVLMVYVYKKDQRDTEPVGLLAMCLLMGVCAALLSIAGEGFGMYALNMSQIDQTTPLYVMALAFGVVAVVEEGSKLLFLYLKTWKSPYFDYKFDGIISPCSCPSALRRLRTSSTCSRTASPWRCPVQSSPSPAT